MKKMALFGILSFIIGFVCAVWDPTIGIIGSISVMGAGIIYSIDSRQK